MINHEALGANSFARLRQLHRLIRQRKVVLGGNRRLKIYGTLQCASGRKMKAANRVFFASEEEAVVSGYRPCARCMKTAYLLWKNNL